MTGTTVKKSAFGLISGRSQTAGEEENGTKA
jgi:hypothetical protein